VDTGTLVVAVLVTAEVVFVLAVVVVVEVVVDALLHPPNAIRAIASKIDENRIIEPFMLFIFSLPVCKHYLLLF
jgi:hypothetical protein